MQTSVPWPIQWTVRLEKNYALGDYLAEFEHEDVGISPWAEPLIQSANIHPVPFERYQHIVRPHLRELGVTDDVPYKEALGAARDKGLSPCTVDTILALRLQLRRHPDEDWIRFGMEPIREGRGYTEGLCLARYWDRDWVAWCGYEFTMTGYYPRRLGPNSRLAFVWDGPVS